MSDYYRIILIPDREEAPSEERDSQAHFLFHGDRSQISAIRNTLLKAGFPVVEKNIYPGFTKENEKEYRKALALLYKKELLGGGINGVLLYNTVFAPKMISLTAKNQSSSNQSH